MPLKCRWFGNHRPCFVIVETDVRDRWIWNLLGWGCTCWPGGLLGIDGGYFLGGLLLSIYTKLSPINGYTIFFLCATGRASAIWNSIAIVWSIFNLSEFVKIRVKIRQFGWSLFWLNRSLDESVSWRIRINWNGQSRRILTNSEQLPQRIILPLIISAAADRFIHYHNTW